MFNDVALRIFINLHNVNYGYLYPALKTFGLYAFDSTYTHCNELKALVHSRELSFLQCEIQEIKGSISAGGPMR